MSEPRGWSRRDFGRAAALLALAMGAPPAGAAAAGSATGAASAATMRASLGDRRQRKLLRQVSQLVIPRSGTPGAGELGVGDFVLLALAHGHGGVAPAHGQGGAMAPALAGYRRGDGTFDCARWLHDELNRRVQGAWLAGTPAAQAAALAALDAQAYARTPDAAAVAPWLTLKGLILTGYYTTQDGASRELRYEFTPGRFDGDLPLKPGDTGWSSDWNAVEFG